MLPLRPHQGQYAGRHGSAAAQGRPATMRRALPTFLSRLALRGMAALTLIWMLFPIYWAIVVSFKPPRELFRPSFVPFLQFAPTLGIWRQDLVLHGAEFLPALRNSLVVATAATALAMLLGTLAGYGLARFHVRLHLRLGRRLLNRGLLVLLVVPRLIAPAALVTPYFLLFQALHLVNTLPALVLVDATLTLPFCVVVTYDLVRRLDREIEETAWLDGCSRWRAFWYVVWPQLGATRFALFAICFAFSWNEFLYAVTLTEGATTTLPAAIQVQEDWEMPDLQQFGPRLLITLLPPLLLALAAQRALVEGMSLGLIRRR